MSDKTTDYFIKKALEGYDSKISLLEKKLEQYETVIQNIGLMAQTATFQVEAILNLLIEQKEIITEEEAKQAIEHVVRQAQSVMENRQKESDPQEA